MINIMSQALISNAMNPTDIKSLLDEIYNNGSWLEFSQRCIRHRPYIIELQKSFHSFWIEKGHRIRSQVNDDKQLLRVLRILLPPYIGEGLWIYRGENLARFEAQKIGFCWTAREDIAKMFASGLNAYKTGGVLLKAWASPAAIISGTHGHSKYLGEDEITVDGFSVENLQVLLTFPASH